MSGKPKAERGPRSWEEARRLARARAAAMSDAEDAALTAAAVSDPDNPPLTTEQIARMHPMNPERLKRLRGQRGPQSSKPLKERIALRLSPDVVAHFRATGPGWQTRINAALERVVEREKRRTSR